MSMAILLLAIVHVTVSNNLYQLLIIHCKIWDIQYTKKIYMLNTFSFPLTFTLTHKRATKKLFPSLYIPRTHHNSKNDV